MSIFPLLTQIPLKPESMFVRTSPVCLRTPVPHWSSAGWVPVVTLGAKHWKWGSCDWGAEFPVLFSFNDCRCKWLCLACGSGSSVWGGVCRQQFPPAWSPRGHLLLKKSVSAFPRSVLSQKPCLIFRGWGGDALTPGCGVWKHAAPCIQGDWEGKAGRVVSVPQGPVCCGVSCLL